MEEASSPKLHDSLDLAALREQIAAEQRTLPYLKKWIRYVLIVMGSGLIFAFFANFLATASPSLVTPIIQIMDIGFWLLIGVAFLLFFVFTVTIYRQHRAFVKRFDLYAPDFVPRSNKREAITLFAAIPVYGVVFLIGMAFLQDWIIIWIGIGLIVLALYFGYFFLMRWICLGGLSRINRYLTILPGNLILLGNKAAFLIQTNHLDDALQILRDLLSRSRHRNISHTPLLLNNYGLSLFLMERYGEAHSMLEACLRISPTFSYGYVALAGWYLEQHLDPERALEFTDIALELTGSKNIPVIASRQAINARALALTGRDTRADAMLSQALETAERLPAYFGAGIHHEAGYARLAQNNREAALEHFKKAVELDPNGIYGKLAQKALDSLAPPP
jgi:hypothetical protein